MMELQNNKITQFRNNINLLAVGIGKETGAVDVG